MSEVPEVPELSSFDVFKGSVTLENKGAVARDHLANERTFLAWLRTSLSFVTIGVGITQLFKLTTDSSVKLADRIILLESLDDRKDYTGFGRRLGLAFVALGIVTLLFGIVRFFQVQHLLVHNLFPATRLSLIVLIVAILVVVLCALVVIVKSF